MTFTFEIASKKYGAFAVTAPERFRCQIEEHTWCVRKDKGRAAGREFVVMTSVPSGAIVEGRVRFVSLLLHKFIWALARREPAPQIDHIDGQPLNNDEDNLRAANAWQNGANRRRQRNNTSGVKGVHPQDGKWVAQIRAAGKRHYLGFFDTVEEARDARDKAAAALHGSFAITSTQETTT